MKLITDVITDVTVEEKFSVISPKEINWKLLPPSPELKLKVKVIGIYIYTYLYYIIYFILDILDILYIVYCYIIIL